MFWRLLVKIGMDLLVSLIVEFVLTAIRMFFVDDAKPQRTKFA